MEVPVCQDERIKAVSYRIPGEPDIFLHHAFCGSPQGLKHRLQQVKEMKLGPDDILILTYPRSGTHWLYEIVSMLLQQKAQVQERYMGLNCMPERISEESMAALVEQPSPRVICTHLLPRHFTDQLAEVKPRIIYGLRNPKDALVSMYRMFNTMVSEKMNFDASFDKYFKVCGRRAGLNNGGWLYHVSSIEAFQAAHPRCPVHVVVYEQLKQNPEAVISNLASILGVSDVIVPDIVRTATIANMKSAPAFTMLKPLFKDGADGMVCKGEIGKWRQIMSQSQSEQLDQEFESKMGDSPLAEMVRPYM